MGSLFRHASNSRPVSQLFVQRPDGARDARAVPAEAAVVGGGDAGERVADGHEDKCGGSEKEDKKKFNSFQRLS